MNQTTEHRTFLRAAVRNPDVIGAVAPSARGLAEQLATIVPSRGAPTVVELGPGTGSVSRAIRHRLPPDGRQLAVEIDPSMISHLTAWHPWLTVLPGDAATLQTLLAEHGVHQVDAVVSGLPWAVFGRTRQDRILTALCQVLQPAGAFTTFGYLHAMPTAPARRFRAQLRRRFDEVVITRAVWLNLPPALVYVCRRPVRHA